MPVKTVPQVEATPLLLNWLPSVFNQLTPLLTIPVRLGLGLIGSAVIAIFAYRRRSLSRSGVAGTILVGTSIFGFGGSAWWVLLIAFFVSASGLSHWRTGQKRSLMEKFSKGARRDIWQVLANGGLGSLLAVAYALEPSPWLWTAFAGSIASANADTWATELGVLNPSPPRLITTGRPVESGTNGAISPVGTAAALAGAAFIGLLATFFSPGLERWSLFLAISVGGLTGALFDSLLGATVQHVYICDACHVETEHRIHHCGRKTRHLRGWPWLDNDGVNFLSAGVGVLISVAILRILL